MTRSRSAGITTAPPALNGLKISKIARSKLNALSARLRSRSLNPKYRRTPSSMFTALRCSIATPLGVPVEPEVKMI
ncbi:hypothetical protein AK51_31800 [Serratia nematodiphila DZ0503SBS1]|nr:hypothetical protein AK51_31800 [Serratia nematodiphila DZ0503SBS1]